MILYALHDVSDILFETTFRFCAKNPILRPVPSVDIVLRIVVPYRLFFWNVISITSQPGSFCG